MLWLIVGFLALILVALTNGRDGVRTTVLVVVGLGLLWAVTSSVVPIDRDTALVALVLVGAVAVLARWYAAERAGR